MRGVLVFGADNEAKAKREAYNLLNEVIYMNNVTHQQSTS